MSSPCLIFGPLCESTQFSNIAIDALRSNDFSLVNKIICKKQFKRIFLFVILSQHLSEVRLISIAVSDQIIQVMFVSVVEGSDRVLRQEVRESDQTIRYSLLLGVHLVDPNIEVINQRLHRFLCFLFVGDLLLYRLILELSGDNSCLVSNVKMCLIGVTATSAIIAMSAKKCVTKADLLIADNLSGNVSQIAMFMTDLFIVSLGHTTNCYLFATVSVSANSHWKVQLYLFEVFGRYHQFWSQVLDIAIEFLDLFLAFFAYLYIASNVFSDLCQWFGQQIDIATNIVDGDRVLNLMWLQIRYVAR